jgi:hypothetical protein
MERIDDLMAAHELETRIHDGQPYTVGSTLEVVYVREKHHDLVVIENAPANDPTRGKNHPERASHPWCKRSGGRIKWRLARQSMLESTLAPATLRWLWQ